MVQSPLEIMLDVERVRGDDVLLQHHGLGR